MTPPPDKVTAQTLGVVAALLGQGQVVDRLSRAITVAALIALVAFGMLADRPPVAAMALLAAIVLVGLIELWFAIRTGIDAVLFDRLSRAPDGPDWPAFYEALLRLGMMPPEKAGRPEAARIAGARRLLRFQAIAMFAQLGLAVAVALFGAVR